MVSNLIRCFEQNSTESVKISQNDTKIDDLSLINIKKGSVRNAFEKLMSQKGVGSPSTTPQKKKIKRLKSMNIASGQKRLDSWVKK